MERSDFSKIYLTVSEVSVYYASEGSWVTIDTPNKTVDLQYLTLMNTSELLTATNISPGKYAKVKYKYSGINGVKLNGESVSITSPTDEIIVDTDFVSKLERFDIVLTHLDLPNSIKQIGGVYEFVPTVERVEHKWHSFETNITPASLGLGSGLSNNL